MLLSSPHRAQRLSLPERSGKLCVRRPDGTGLPSLQDLRYLCRLHGHIDNLLSYHLGDSSMSNEEKKQKNIDMGALELEMDLWVHLTKT